MEQIWSDDIEVTAVTSGENIKIKIKGIDDGDVSPGFVLCSSVNPITTGKVFDAQVFKIFLEKFSVFYPLYFLDCNAGPQVNRVCRVRLYDASAGNGRGGKIRKTP